MTLEQYSYLAQIIGPVVVIASLVYVARQLHQNTEMLKSQSRQALLENDHRNVLTGIEYAEVFEALAKPEPLSFVNQYRLDHQGHPDERYLYAFWYVGLTVPCGKAASKPNVWRSPEKQLTVGEAGLTVG
jgi:hypothetical protein